MVEVPIPDCGRRRRETPDDDREAVLTERYEASRDLVAAGTTGDIGVVTAGS